MKRHLQIVTKNCTYEYEQYSTLLCQIKAILNSRPFTSLQDNPGTVEILTPGHFLIGESIVALSDKDYSNLPNKIMKIWEDVQKRTQHTSIPFNNEPNGKKKLQIFRNRKYCTNKGIKYASCKMGLWKNCR